MAQSVVLYPIGVGSYSTIRDFYTNTMLDIDGRRIFIDAPAYLHKQVAWHQEHGELAYGFEDYNEVILTHMHADHAGGLEELCWHQLYQTQDRIKLYAPDWMLEDAWRTVEPANRYSFRGDPNGDAEPPYWPPPGAVRTALDWFFEPIELANPHDFGDFVLHRHVTRHLPKTSALKFDFGDFKFGMSSDTGFYPDLIEWLDECDVVLHEVLFGPHKLLGGDLRNIHTTVDQLLTLPESFQRKTYLYHYGDEAYEVDPDRPSVDLGAYRLLVRGKKYQLVGEPQAEHA